MTLVFIDSTLQGSNLQVWRCSVCKTQFEIKFLNQDDQDQDPEYCPACGLAKDETQ